jgi:hypothetical protein
MSTRLTRTAALSTAAFLLAAVPAVQVAAAASTAVSQSEVRAAAKPALTAHATVKSIGAWQQFRVYGSSSHLRAGTRVTLQQLQRKHWVSLPAHMNTNRKGAYSLRVMLGLKGVNQIRIAGGGAVSPVVKVTVR